MAVDMQSREQAVSNAVKEISHIATLPEVTIKIIELVDNPSSTAQDLHKVIANDPALSSRILKVVNSAFYGLPGQIGSINRAIVLLGLNAVKNIAIAASLTKLFKGGELTPGFAAKNLWDHSTRVAAAAKLIADSLKLGLTDEAFLAGLMHDLGIIVEIQYDRHKLIEVINQVGIGEGGAPAGNMLAVEDATFGANHQDFGQGLCERWKFPKSFAFVTGFHHRPLDLPADARTLPSIICIADRLACDPTVAPGSIGFRLDLPDISLPADVMDSLRLSQQHLDAIKAKLPDALANVNAVLS